MIRLSAKNITILRKKALLFFSRTAYTWQKEQGKAAGPGQSLTEKKNEGKSMLYIKNLTKTYGEKKAVDDLSLHIAPGEIYGFIGHNGAGKTTTLKSVTGILQFDSGEITIGGRSIRQDPIGCKAQMAYIPDNPDLYEFMTGIKYLNFIADIFGNSIGCASGTNQKIRGSV